MSRDRVPPERRRYAILRTRTWAVLRRVQDPGGDTAQKRNYYRSPEAVYRARSELVQIVTGREAAEAALDAYLRTKGFNMLADRARECGGPGYEKPATGPSGGEGSVRLEGQRSVPVDGLAGKPADLPQPSVPVALLQRVREALECLGDRRYDDVSELVRDLDDWVRRARQDLRAAPTLLQRDLVREHLLRELLGAP